MQSFKRLKKRIRAYLRKRLLDILDPVDEPDPRKDMIIGRYTYGVRRESVPNYETKCHHLTVGSFCSIAPDVRFVFGRHQIYAPSTFPMREFVKKQWDPATWPKDRIVVGNDVWIASNVLVLPNVTIGHGAVICAGAVVTKDIPPYAIAAGVPATVLKYRMNPDQIAKMVETAWWDWPEEKILAHLEEFYGDIDAFLNQHWPGPRKEN